MKTKQTRLKLASTAAIAASFALGSAAHAADNPFGMQKLEGGYQLAQADKKADGKCGGSKGKDGACGGAKADDKKADGKCGGSKGKDGACGGAKADDKKKEGACGGSKGKDGACGAKK